MTGTTTTRPKLLTITKLTSTFSATYATETGRIEHFGFFSNATEIRAYAKQAGYTVRKIKPGRTWNLAPVAYELVQS